MSRLVQPLNALVITLITCMQLATVDVSCRVLGHSDKNIDTSVIVMLCEEAGQRYLDVLRRTSFVGFLEQPTREVRELRLQWSNEPR